MLYDNHGRLINYIRIAVTDRCNLRCYYCMPEEGIKYVPRAELLTYEELERILGVLAPMGISKVRITGGEPFVRKGLLDFMTRVSEIDGINQMHITTNGTFTDGVVPALKKMGIRGVNLSLDSVDKERFFKVTRRDCFGQVMTFFDQLMEEKIPTKINMVVLNGRNEEDIYPMIELAKKHPISVRFIEEMPFNGEGVKESFVWNHKKIIDHIRLEHPQLQKIQDPDYSTSFNYKIPGHVGSVGVIAAYTRSFCGTCNRIRLTATGTLKTCLYDDGVFNIKNFIRQGASDEQLRDLFLELLGHRPKDGHEAERNRNSGLPITESMSTIGG